MIAYLCGQLIEDNPLIFFSNALSFSCLCSYSDMICTVSVIVSVLLDIVAQIKNTLNCDIFQVHRM